MTRKCVICGVYNRNSHVSVFRFPSCKILRQKWTMAARVSRVGSSHGVCAKHFKANDFSPTETRVRLLNSAVPSVQLDHPSYCVEDGPGESRRVVQLENTEPAYGVSRDMGHQSTSAAVDQDWLPTYQPNYERRSHILGLVATGPAAAHKCSPKVITHIPNEDVAHQKRARVSSGAASLRLSEEDRQMRQRQAGSESSELPQLCTISSGVAALPSETAAPGQKRSNAVLLYTVRQEKQPETTKQSKRVPKQQDTVVSGKEIVVKRITYQRLQMVQEQLNCQSVASTVDHLAKWYLRSRAVEGGQRNLQSLGAPARRTVPATIQTQPAPAAVAQTQPATDDVAQTQRAPAAVAQTQPATADVAQTQPAADDVAQTQRATDDVAQTQPAPAAVAQRQPATDDVAQTQHAVQAPVAAAESADNSVVPCPPDYREYSFIPGGAAPAPRRGMAEAELLESLDLALETADDPGAASDEESSPEQEQEQQEGEGAACRGRHWDVRSAVVSEPQLLVLLAEAAAVCPQCRVVVSPHVARRGLAYLVTWRCGTCQRDARKPWHSTQQTPPGRAAVFDTVFAAAVTLSGCSVAAVRRLMAFCNLGALSGAAYRSVTDELVHPVIDQAYWAAIDANRTAALHASPDGLVLAGDYQEDASDCDTSYGVYTVLDHATGRIVAQSTVLRHRDAAASSRGEEEAARRCLTEIREAGISVVEFISDRRVGLKSIVERILPGVRYSYDVWRVATGIASEVNEFAVRSRYTKLKPWVPRLKQHFWWCAKTSGGDQAIFRRRWSMFSYHMCDMHVTANGANRCHHEPAPEEEKREEDDEEEQTEFLTPCSNAHIVVQGIVLRRDTLALAGPCASFRHCGQLRVYHQLSSAYTASGASSYSDCVARKQLAMLDMTEHLQRPFQRDKDGSVRVRSVYSGVLDRYVVRPLKTAKTFPHVRSLLAEIVELGRRQAQDL